MSKPGKLSFSRKWESYVPLDVQLSLPCAFFPAVPNFPKFIKYYLCPSTTAPSTPCWPSTMALSTPFWPFLQYTFLALYYSPFSTLAPLKWPLLHLPGTLAQDFDCPHCILKKALCSCCALKNAKRSCSAFFKTHCEPIVFLKMQCECIVF